MYKADTCLGLRIRRPRRKKNQFAKTRFIPVKIEYLLGFVLENEGCYNFSLLVLEFTVHSFAPPEDRGSTRVLCPDSSFGEAKREWLRFSFGIRVFRLVQLLLLC